MNETVVYPHPFLMGGGEMGELTRNYDWAGTAVGTPDQWPHSLRTAVGIVLQSRFPMFLWWGHDLVQFYNDAYRPSLGKTGKHPVALGQRGQDCWPEIWPVIKPLIDQVQQERQATWSEDQLLPIYRNGRIEDVYWTFSYSPVIGDSGGVEGVLVVCQETTSMVRLQFPVEAARLALWSLNPATNRFTVNARYAEWFGVGGNDEIELALVMQVTAAEDRDRVEQAYRKALDSAPNSTLDIEYTIRPENLPERRVKAMGKVWFDTGGNAYQFNGTLQDITEEAAAKKLLLESSQSLHMAMEIGELGVFKIDLPTQTATYSPLIAQWFSLDKPHMSVSDIFERVHPDDKPHVTQMLQQHVAGALAEGHDITYRLTTQPPRHLHSVGKVVWQDGEPAFILGIVQDITRQVQARQVQQENETYFREIIDTLPAIVWITKPDGYCTYLNRNWYECTGQTPEQAEGFGRLTATHPDDREEARKVFAEANARQESFRFVYRLRNKQGEYRWAIDKGSPRFADDGTYMGMVGTVVDVHDEKIADEKVRQSEARFRSLIAAAPAGIVLFVGRDLVIENPNQTFIDIVGKGPGIEGMTLRAAMPELTTEGQPFLDILDEVYVTGSMFQLFGSQAKIMQNGVMTDNYYNITYTPLRDAEGRVHAILNIAINVTEEIKARQRLEESEQEFRTLADNIQNLAWIADGDGWIFWYNQRWYDYTGTTLEEMQGWGWQKVHHPDHADRVVDFVKSAWHVNDPFELTFPLRSSGGEYRWFLTRAHPIADATGKVIRWIGTNTDIDEQKKAEDQFRMLADQSPMWVWMTDKEIGATYANPALLRFLGLSHLDQFTGHAWQQLIHPDDIAGVYRSFDAAVAAQQEYEVEVRYKNGATGAYEWFYVKGVPNYEAGIFMGFIGIGVNIQQQKETQETLEKQVAERTADLERSNTELAQFAYVASHDLQEPVRKIKTFGDLLRKELVAKQLYTPEAAQQNGTVPMYLDRITNASSRMMMLIRDILDFSRLSKVGQAFQQVDMTQLMAEVCQDYELLIAEKAARLHTDPLPIVEAIPLQIRQLFTNLIGNSLKFTAEGRLPLIHIRCRPLEEAEVRADAELQPELSYVQIEFSDNGIGFEQQYAEQIFTIFQRLHDRNSYAGTGIGLALCRKIMANHHGSIYAQSAEGEGAVFFIALPLRQPPS